MPFGIIPDLAFGFAGIPRRRSDDLRVAILPRDGFLEIYLKGGHNLVSLVDSPGQTVALGTAFRWGLAPGG